MNDYNFGNFLYSLRTEKGLSQSQLGEMLGVTNKAVSKWENGSAKPNTKLIPKIAEIFSITVEEIFACKRIELDMEYENIKKYLSAQKRKFAVLSSAFLSAVIVIPLWLIEFICVVFGFGVPDDIIGPLGAVGLILSFIIALTTYIIYRKNYKKALTPDGMLLPEKFEKGIKRGVVVSFSCWYGIFILTVIFYSLLLFFAPSILSANIFLSVMAFIWILMTAVLICLLNIKCLLSIKIFNKVVENKKRIVFSQLSLKHKICYIAFIVLYFLFAIVGGILMRNMHLFRLLFIISGFACLGAAMLIRLNKK